MFGDKMTKNPYPLNERVEGFSCLRCKRAFSLNDTTADLGQGCLSCLAEGFPASLQIDYAAAAKLKVQEMASGMRRYASQLPYREFPHLGEGLTPLIRLPSLAKSLGLGQIWLKNEGQNPTGSHKDRMSALVTARAVTLGRKPVVAASSGNAGASLAAYAAAAGLRCAIISTKEINPVWARAIQITGAELILTDTSMARWQLMRQMVEEEGWYPVTNYIDPPVGSNPFGVQGYKTVAYEILEQCGETPPTTILVPTARGDLLWGIWAGLLDAERFGLLPERPRLIAVEPVERLRNVLAGADYRQHFAEEPHGMISISGATATYQSMIALQESKGAAVEVTTEDAVLAQEMLARHGIYVEMSSAASLAGLRLLSNNRQINMGERVVLIATSHGYKELPD
jgi:threonine synthase